METFCLHGIDINFPISLSGLQCFLKNLQKGVDFVVVRAYTADGALDSSAIANLRLIQSTGITGDIYMETCRAKDAI